MITIQNKQLDAMRNDMFKRSCRKLEVHLQQRYPEQTKQMDYVKLQELVSVGVGEAKKYQMTDNNDVKRFLEYQLEYGRHFGFTVETQWAGQFLNNQNLTGTAKLDEIDNHRLFVIELGK